MEKSDDHIDPKAADAHLTKIGIQINRLRTMIELGEQTLKRARRDAMMPPDLDDDEIADAMMVRTSSYIRFVGKRDLAAAAVPGIQAGLKRLSERLKPLLDDESDILFRLRKLKEAKNRAKAETVKVEHDHAMRPIDDAQQHPANLILLMNEKEVSERYGFTLSWLRHARFKGTGPKFVKIGSMVRYKPEDVNEFIDNHRVTSMGETV